MSPKQPSKQKRAAQNRNQRAARAARAANANAESTPSTRGGASAPASSGGSLLSRLRGGGASGGGARAGATPATSPRTRGGAQTANQPPGYRAALSAVIAAAAGLILCTVALRYPVNAQGDVYTPESLVADWSVTALQAVADQPEATPAEVIASIDDWTPGRSKEPVAQALWPFSLTLVLPLIGAGLGFHAVRRRATSKVVNRALYATLFGAILTQSLLLLFLPVVLAMAVAMFQVRKAETIAAASGASAATDASGVIEVAEVVEDAPAVEDVSAVDDDR